MTSEDEIKNVEPIDIETQEVEPKKIPQPSVTVDLDKLPSAPLNSTAKRSPTVLPAVKKPS